MLAAPVGPDAAWLSAHGLRDPHAPTMLFGSHARGDARPESDIDVLQVAPNCTAYSEGVLSVTRYQLHQLQSMMARGSLFGLHLKTDGVVLIDPNNHLTSVLQQWRKPSSYESLMTAIREVSGALSAKRAVFERNARGYQGLAVFLARTEVYARCAASGEPEFDVTRAAYRCGVPELAEALARVRISPPSWESFASLRGVLRASLNIDCENPYGSDEALAVRLSHTSPVGAALVLRLLAGDTSIQYQGLPVDYVPW